MKIIQSLGGLVVLSCLLACGGPGADANSSALAGSGTVVTQMPGGRCLDASSSAGSHIEIWDCWNTPRQQFHFDSSTGELRMYNDSVCIDASGGTGKDGEPIIAWPCHGGPNQKWTYNNQTQEIVGLNGKCLDVVADNSSNGAQLQLYKCGGGANQRWTVSGSGAPDAGSFAVSNALVLSTLRPTTGSTVTATVTYTNGTSSPISIKNMGIAGRPPAATHHGGPFDDFTPLLGAATVQPGATVTLRASRTFTSSDPSGQWESYASYQDSNGAWHDDSTSVFFNYSAAPSAPPQAAAAGYRNLSFSTETRGWDISPDGNGVHDWYPTGYYHSVLPTSGYSVTDGILTMNTDTSGYGWGLGTSGLNSAGQVVGKSWQHAYFEASLAFTPSQPQGGAWPAFWSWAVESLSQPNRDFTELDFFEAFPQGTGIDPIFTIHDHNLPDGGSVGDGHSPSLPAGTDFTQFHTYGCLWVEGKATWFFDNRAVASTSWAPGESYSVTDTDHLLLILGTGTNWPMRVGFVNVWQ